MGLTFSSAEERATMGNRETPPLSRIPAGNDIAKVTDALLFAAVFDF